MIMNSKAADCILSKYVSETVDYREDCTQCNKMYSNKTQRRFPYSGRSVRGLVDSRTLDQWLNIPTQEQRVAQALLTYDDGIRYPAVGWGWGWGEIERF